MANVVTKPILLDETGQAIVTQLQRIAQSGGGHIIENATGTEMTKRSALQFVGATVTDDSTNDKTVVTIPNGGHTIENAAGTEMTKRDVLQFVNSTVTDDSTNEKTVVKPNNINTTTVDPGEGSALATNNLLIVVE